MMGGDKLKDCQYMFLNASRVKRALLEIDSARHVAGWLVESIDGLTWTVS
jgi:hypothetical protein